MKKVVVIGGGIGGLATAALLAKDGYSVTVLEKNQELGGRARMWKSEGFSFDMGPSWYMMPDAFDHFYAQFGKKISDVLNLARLDTHYKVFFTPDRTYSISSDMQKNYSLFEKTSPGSAAALKTYLEKSKWIYETAMRDLVFQDYESLLPLLTPSTLFNLFRFNLFTSFHSYVRKFISHKDLQKILEFTTVFLGGSPYNTPAFYSLISHTDFGLGIFHPMGGMHTIVESLERLCKEHNVVIKTGVEAASIKVVNGKAVAVKTLSGESIDTDVVVGNADYAHIETDLLSKTYRSIDQSAWEAKQPAPSALLMYIGLKEKLPGIAHHNLYFDDSWEDHFSSVYAKQEWPTRPSYFVHAPTVTDPSLAPPGGEVLIFLVPVAAGLPDNDTVRIELSQRVMAHFEHLIHHAFQKNIVVSRIFSHRDFISDYHAYKGSAFGLAHTLFQTALFRPLNRSKKVKNLYFAGQYTNPGVGVPVCLISAQIVAKTIKRHE